MSKKQQPVPRRRAHADGEPRMRATAAELDARYSFRRNRTLTGSLSSDVQSAGEANSELKSPRVHAHNLRKHRRRALSALALVVLAAGGLTFLLLQSIVSIKVVPNVALSDSKMYEQKVHDYLTARPFERFRFSLNAESLAAYLQSRNMPEVSAVHSNIEPSGIGGAKLSIDFRRPVVAWQTAGTKLYVDSLGNSFQQNYYPEPAVQVVDKTGIQSQNNQILASNRFLGFIGKVIGRMKDNGVTVTEIILPADTTRQVQVRAEGVDYPIKFSVDRPVGEQAEDAARAIRYLQKQGSEPEYLDVRVSGKAFYR